ncbi:protein kinase domain-containing protein [Gordonia rhizosphera]|uniref:non-specific serine/threonine protein kinase n=1 Tax=Gordonia rhizosphera NBRC 16068 TaxID=1108045 RepID=K6W9I3_9ACTN|nr:protein kinase [Gordonia rhizosphera]GAB90416.1 serine/threonine protein kinase PknL [Gordonia rhizosphera NBRC 16068]
MRPPADTLLGSTLEGRYRIDAPIARGGMSAVYVGADLRLGRAVAIKVMDARYSGDPSFLRRFEFEARAVAGLKHPGLVAVYDQGIDDGVAFLVMELVEGGSLRELLRERGPMPPHAVTAVADPVLGGLGTAHAAGLVHRDVKPENVLISDDGEVKVADFGLVRAVAEAGVTSASVILGTAAYLSPEQVESGEADARSDVYSTGVMIFELLTGRTPFHGDTPLALAYQRLSYDVPAPGDVVAGVPEEFDELVLRATERNPADRYADGFAMQRALLDAADDLNLPPFTVPAPRRSAERETMARMRAAHPAGADAASPHPTRVQSQPEPMGSEPPPPPVPQDDLVVGTRRPRVVDDATRSADRPGDNALRAVLWIALVLLLAVAIGAVAWWAGATYLS